MAILFPAPNLTSKKVKPNETNRDAWRMRRCGLVMSLMLLDILGVILMIIGIRQQIHHQSLLPDSLSTPYAGAMLLIAGVVLTLPFFVWSVKASFGPFRAACK
jgi:hypothetical protein